tara:strand:+ start:4452 stop:5906 length:1455 start_codon:yes stop_codon:yes gene_type:complete
MIIDKIYVINLNTEQDIIWQKLRDLNIATTDCFILDAVNGWDLVEGRGHANIDYKKADWWKSDSTNSFHNREMTPGEIGCMLSHYQCVKDAYDNGHENCMILEEDFVSTNTFPSSGMFSELPKDWSMVYLGRNALNAELETEVSTNVVNAHYSYNCHAYMLSRKGMKEVIDSPILSNLIPTDEFYSALNGTHDRKDAVKVFNTKSKFKQYSFKKEYIKQASSIPKGTSLTEFKPKDKKPTWLSDDIVKEAEAEVKNIRSFKSVLKTKPIPSPVIAKATVDTSGILDDGNWDEWSKKYVNPLLMNGEYDLITDEPAPHVYMFPLFTEAFCKQLVALSEQFPWKDDRHTFYPTTDNLLEVLGMKDIYNKVINTYVRPYAIDRYKLEGKDWDKLRDESFIIKYPHDKQSHLSVHHDYGNITTLVNLNPGEFEGGGTYFPKYKCNVNPKQVGIATLHPSNITHKHGARAVTKGTRYVVVSFIKGASHK